MKKHNLLVVSALILLALGTAFVDVYIDRPLAIIRRYKPDVEIKKAGTGTFVPATSAHQLFSGDTLKTGPEGYAAVQFMDNSLVKVKPNSILSLMGEVRGKDNTASRLAVQVGEIFLNVTKRESDFEVQSTNTVAAVKGTRFSFSMKEDGSVVVLVTEGKVEVSARSSGKKSLVNPGQKAEVSTNGKEIETSKATPEEMKAAKADEQQTLPGDNQDENGQGQDDKPKVIKLRFINNSGEVREFEIKYREEN